MEEALKVGGACVDPATNNAVPASRERAEYVAKAGPYDRYQAMQDLRDANRGKCPTASAAARSTSPSPAP